MDGASDQFLAGSAFAGDEHGGVEVGDAADELINALHLRAGADETVAAGGLFELLLDGLELFFEGGVLARPAEHGFEIANRRRAAAVAESAVAHQLKGGGAKAIVGHDDRWDIRSNQLT